MFLFSVQERFLTVRAYGRCQVCQDREERDRGEEAMGFRVKKNGRARGGQGGGQTGYLIRTRGREALHRKGLLKGRTRAKHPFAEVREDDPPAREECFSLLL